MDIARAVSMLRQKTGMSQRELAEKLGTATETVSRWETGRRVPNTPVLKALADLASSAGLSSLSSFFERERTRIIAATVRNLPSAGTQRRVAVDDLASWENWAALISGVAGALLGELGDKLDQEQRGALVGLKGAGDLLRNEVHLHVKGGAPKKNPLTEEQAARLRELHIPEFRKEKPSGRTK